MNTSIVEKSFCMVEYFYNKCHFSYTYPELEKEGHDYGASTFRLNDLSINFRIAKTTPKKIGQFVTLWKRNNEGITAPHDLSDAFDLFVINTHRDDLFGQFVFPKSVLCKRGIVSNGDGKGKRGIRVYPSWDKPTSQQAIKTQKWQSEFFLKMDLKKGFDLDRAKKFYLIDLE